MTSVQELLLAGVGSDALRAMSCRSCSSTGACNKDTPKLPPGELHDKLAAVPAWKPNERLTVISRSFVAKDFMAAVRFITAVAELAEAEGHHPDLHIECYRDVRIDLTTHATGGLTLADLIMAAKIDAIPVAYSSRWLKKQQQAVMNMRADCFGGSSRKSLDASAQPRADRAASLPSWELTPPPSRKPSMTHVDMNAAADAARSLMYDAATRRTSLTLPSPTPPKQGSGVPAGNHPPDVALTLTPSGSLDSLQSAPEPLHTTQSRFKVLKQPSSGPVACSATAELARISEGEGQADAEHSAAHAAQANPKQTPAPSQQADDRKPALQPVRIKPDNVMRVHASCISASKLSDLQIPAGSVEGAAMDAQQQYEAAGSGKESDELAHAEAVMSQALAS